jgi:hypothetical protein
MPTIGSYFVSAWPRGRLETSHLEIAALDPWPGVNGLAFVRGAYQTNPSECETAVDVSPNRGDAELLETNYKALIGMTVQVIDSVGKIWPTVFVRRVQTAIEWNSVTNRWRLRAVWFLHPLTQETRS